MAGQTQTDKLQEKIKDKLLFDMKLISPMVSKELEYNANELAKETLQACKEAKLTFPNGSEIEI